jgi:hypothetical protein
VRFAIWNATASEEYKFSETAMSLLKFSTSVVPRDEVARKMLARYGAKPINEIFDLSSVYLSGIQKRALIDLNSFESKRITVNFGHQMIPFKETLLSLYSNGSLVTPDTVLNLDSREYPGLLSDEMMAIDLFGESGIEYEIKKIDDFSEFFLDLDQKIENIKESVLVETSRYHVAIAALVFKINFVLVSYNNKFDVIHKIANSRKIFENEKISICDFSQNALDDLVIRNSVARWKDVCNDFLYG